MGSIGLGGSDQGVTMGDQVLREHYLVQLLLLLPLTVVAIFGARRVGRLALITPWVCLAIATLALVI